MLGERNESLLKAFHTDSIVEELKSALHLSFERFEHAQSSLAEAERDVAELRRQLDENVDRGVELEQEVSDLRGFGEEANRKVEKATLAHEEVAEKVEELEKRGEEAARANEGLEAQNSSLRRKLLRADVERAEKTKAFYSDVRSRLDDAEAELLAYRENRDKAKALAEKAAGEIALLKEQLVKSEMQRDEETVRADEESARSEDLHAQLESVKARVGELMATNEKNSTLLQIEANRRLLEIKLLTPSKLLMRETPVKATPMKPRTFKFGAITTPSVGGGLGSAFKAVHTGTSMTPVPETPMPDPQCPPKEDFEEVSRAKRRTPFF